MTCAQHLDHVTTCNDWPGAPLVLRTCGRTNVQGRSMAIRPLTGHFVHLAQSIEVRQQHVHTVSRAVREAYDDWFHEGGWSYDVASTRLTTMTVRGH